MVTFTFAECILKMSILLSIITNIPVGMCVYQLLFLLLCQCYDMSVYMLCFVFVSSGINSTNHPSSKKRKYSDSPNGSLTPGLMTSMGLGNVIKTEPTENHSTYGNTLNLFIYLLPF